MQAGNSDALVPVIRSYQQQLYVYCCRMLGNEQDAEDAVQDIFIKAYRSITSYRPSVSFNAWLYKIAYNHCLNLLRRHRLFGTSVLSVPRQPYAESAESSALKDVLSEPLTRALARLSPEDRAILLLHVFHERNYREIGEITGKSPESIRKKLDRVKRKVKALLNRQEEEWACPTGAHLKS